MMRGLRVRAWRIVSQIRKEEIGMNVWPCFLTNEDFHSISQLMKWIGRIDSDRQFSLKNSLPVCKNALRLIGSQSHILHCRVLSQCTAIRLR